MIQLTEQQHQAIDQNTGEPLRAIDPASKKEYVLVRAGVYDRIKMMLLNDDDWAGPAYDAAMEVFARDGWDDPRMDVYDAPLPAKP